MGQSEVYVCVLTRLCHVTQGYGYNSALLALQQVLQRAYSSC